MTVTTQHSLGGRLLFAACAGFCKLVICGAGLIAVAGSLTAYLFKRPDLSVPFGDWPLLGPTFVTAREAAFGGLVALLGAYAALLIVRHAAATPPPPTSDAEAYALRHSNWKD